MVASAAAGPVLKSTILIPSNAPAMTCPNSIHFPTSCPPGMKLGGHSRQLEPFQAAANRSAGERHCDEADALHPATFSTSAFASPTFSAAVMMSPHVVVSTGNAVLEALRLPLALRLAGEAHLVEALRDGAGLHPARGMRRISFSNCSEVGDCLRIENDAEHAVETRAFRRRRPCASSRPGERTAEQLARSPPGRSPCARRT